MLFPHLHLHTEFSLTDGLIRIKPLFKCLKERGVTAVALTDQGNLFAAIKFYKAAVNAGIKPILGADVWVQGGAEEATRLTILAQNHAGYLNLSRLLSRGYREGQTRGIPMLQMAWLLEANEGLIVLAGMYSELGQLLLAHSEAQAKKVALELDQYFTDRWYIELTRCHRAQENEYGQLALAFAADHNAPVMASNDVRFAEESDFEAHEARTCIAGGWVVSDTRRPKNYSSDQYIKSPQEMVDLFKDVPQAIENSIEIAKRCTVQLQLGKAFLPDFPIPDGLTEAQYFRQVAEQGLRERVGDIAEHNQQYWQRLETELNVIIDMGFPGYFLIVADFILWAKNHQIPVGPGRGSGAGSLVAWALKITDLDPLPYDLLFERFLNPERVSMPDFDIDFCMEGRDRVIEYVAEKYGREAVSQIATHGTMAAKAVVRDVGRTLGHPYGFVDRIAKLVPFELGITLEKALLQEPELKSAYDTDDEVKTLIDLALQLEGLTRSVGKHAGGVVIAPTTLTDFSPTYCEEGSDTLVAQFDKDDVEAAGLVKFDFLGLRTLTIIDWALQTLAARGTQLAIMDIPLTDRATFDLLKRCETTAVFQLESRGMKDLVRRLQPDTFEDIIALVALFRPGPLESGMVDDFINRKHGRAAVAYPFKELETVLKPTYGVIVYQEQVMQISQTIGNYTLGGADLLRRAMGKKKPEEMAEQRTLFLKGAESLQFDTNKAGALFDLMEKFAGYGFNKSHSAAYALLSYQTAYLKAHYPAAFMAAVLSSDMDKTEKVVTFIEECRQMKLVMAAPGINRSQYRFTVDGDRSIVYGLGAVKGVGENAVEIIVSERHRNGLFTDLFDFCERIDLSKCNRRVLETLIRSGSLDDLMPERLAQNDDLLSIAARCQHRANMMLNLPAAILAAEQRGRDKASGQEDLFGAFDSTDTASSGAMTAILDIAPTWSEAVLLEAEKETLGLFLTAHPIDRYLTEIRSFCSHSLAAIAEMEAPLRRYSKADAPQVCVAGLVTGVRSKANQRGQKMIFVTLDDRSARMEIRLFAEVAEQQAHIIQEDQVLIIKGGLSWDEFSGAMRINADEVLSMDQARARFAKQLQINTQITQLNDQMISQLQNCLYAHRPGAMRILLNLEHVQCRAAFNLGTDWQVQASEALLTQLRSYFGEQAVQLIY